MDQRYVLLAGSASNLYCSSFEAQYYVFDRVGGTTSKLTTSEDMQMSASWSPVDSKVFFFSFQFLFCFVVCVFFSFVVWWFLGVLRCVRMLYVVRVIGGQDKPSCCQKKKLIFCDFFVLLIKFKRLRSCAEIMSTFETGPERNLNVPLPRTVRNSSATVLLTLCMIPWTKRYCCRLGFVGYFSFLIKEKRRRELNEFSRGNC